MDTLQVFTVENVLLSRRGQYRKGNLILSKYHMVFSFVPEGVDSKTKEIWICYPIIEKIVKARGGSWVGSVVSNGMEWPSLSPPHFQEFDRFSASNIRVFCKDFTYYLFDFVNDLICSDVYLKLSLLVVAPKIKPSIRDLYAFEYKANVLESNLDACGWKLYDPRKEYERQNLFSEGSSFWRLSNVNEGYRFSPSYPNCFIVPASISESVLQHAGKFRSKQRIPAVVYKHRVGENGNVIARCAQPLVGLNLQNRSLQDEKLIFEIFNTQREERSSLLSEDSEYREQPQRNLIVDLRPITNAMAQHALGAGTEIVENYRGKTKREKDSKNLANSGINTVHQVDKIFCNIDNIHVMRDSLNKLNSILGDLDRFPISSSGSMENYFPLLQQSLTKTQWLHRLSLILQSVDRISKSIHLNNTNVLIHCSDGWDRTSQVSALTQLCLDPYFRTMKGFMVLIEKEWISFGFKFATRSDHGGCIGAVMPNAVKELKQDPTVADSESALLSNSLMSSSPNLPLLNDSTKAAFSSFFLKAAYHIKTTASNAKSSMSLDSNNDQSHYNTYGGSNERSPIFHQFLDCVYQIFRQNPSKFEFNSRFLKRLFYHSYSCQYGSFLCNSEKEAKLDEKISETTVSVWDYFLSRKSEFNNPAYVKPTGDEVIFPNFMEIKWWCELYGRSEEEMNGLSNSLEKKFAQLKVKKHVGNSSTENGYILLELTDSEREKPSDTHISNASAL